MLYDRKKQHYSAEAWITTGNNSTHDVPNRHTPGMSMEKGATQSLKEVEGITNALDSVPPHLSMKYETDGASGEDGNASVDQTRGYKGPACAAGGQVNQECAHQEEGELDSPEASGTQIEPDIHGMWKEIEEAFCKAEDEHGKNIFKAEEDVHVKKEEGYNTPKRIKTEALAPHTAGMNNNMRMCQVYHGAIQKNGKSRCKIKKKAQE